MRPRRQRSISKFCHISTLLLLRGLFYRFYSEVTFFFYSNLVLQCLQVVYRALQCILLCFTVFTFFYSSFYSTLQPILQCRKRRTCLPFYSFYSFYSQPSGPVDSTFQSRGFKVGVIGATFHAPPCMGCKPHKLDRARI